MNSENKSCFIVTPIGQETSDIRRAIDGVINSVIIPVLEKLNFSEIVAAHHITAPGSINNQVINKIVNDDLVIANLTGLNANVMYELAIRHTTKKPIIHICEEGTSLPFDIKDQRTIFYRNDMKGVNELGDALEITVSEVMKKKQWDDNPIYNAVKDKIFQEILIEKPEKEFEKYLLDRIESMQNKIDTLINSGSMNDTNDIRKNYFRVNSVKVKLCKGDEGKLRNLLKIIQSKYGVKEFHTEQKIIDENMTEYTIYLRPLFDNSRYMDNELIEILNIESKGSMTFYCRNEKNTRTFLVSTE